MCAEAGGRAVGLGSGLHALSRVTLPVSPVGHYSATSCWYMCIRAAL